MLLDVGFCFQENFEGFNISEIIKAGSMGHGTAVPGHFDIDLVIYSRGKTNLLYASHSRLIQKLRHRYTDITGNEVLRQRNEFQPWIKKLHAFLSRELGHNYNYTIMTLCSVQFCYKGMVEVDLLVSPYWSDQHELYRFLQGVPQNKRSMYAYSYFEFRHNWNNL